MTVSKHAVLSRTFQNTNDMGAKAVQSDATLVIDGFEHMVLQFKQFPWPVATTGDVIEYFGPVGQKMVQPQQSKTKQEGPFTIYETVANHCGEFLAQLIEQGGEFNATVYAGRPDDYKKKHTLHKCILVADTPDRDWENDTSPLMVSGTMHYHWFNNQ
ncbi:hypothetical protein [Pseudomonas fulva]|uniref:hypothetical protein n=1 Tax=Pseudomonas fulva TaxID=47880 RepID=UPI001F271458|nr:hypothetical protein [Pseudomonas fulva]